MTKLKIINALVLSGNHGKVEEDLAILNSLMKTATRIVKNPAKYMDNFSEKTETWLDKMKSKYEETIQPNQYFQIITGNLFRKSASSIINFTVSKVQ